RTGGHLVHALRQRPHVGRGAHRHVGGVRMTVRRLAILQWVGLLLGAVTWTFAHLAGIGITQWECNAVGERWGVSNPWTEGGLSMLSLSLVAAAGACAGVVFLRTRGTPFGDGPPE